MKNMAEKTTSQSMTYRTSKTSGQKVSLLGYGMMRLPMKDGKIDQQMVNEEVRFALDHGVNYFDTSPHYSDNLSETSLGVALQASGYPRESYHIATKMSNFDPPECPREKSIEMYHRSFELLHTDYIDYYLLHAVGIGGGMERFRKRFIDNGLLDFLVKEREAGRIRQLGFSYHDDITVFDWLLANHDKYHWDFVQIEMNYVDWHYAKEMNPDNTSAEYLYSECEKRGIQNVMMEPLLGGRLAKLPAVCERQLKSRRPDESIPSWAFRFCGSHPNVLTMLSGMTQMENVVDNVKTCSPLVPCSEEELELLESIAARLSSSHSIPCSKCRYCMPCPFGVDIPGNFSYYNNCITNDSLPPADETSPDYAARQEAFVNGYHEALNPENLATQCRSCRACLPKCPQHIRIPQQLHRLSTMIRK